jgi:UDP-N-acetylmuramoyl-tripeptide--D-alanyl-D-alanine ligase
MEFRLSEVAAALGFKLTGGARITGWCVDSRAVAPGDLFFALRGPNFDGNAYVDDAFQRGAVAAAAERESAAGPVIVVKEGLAALQRVATWARDRWGGDVIGITGSAGKTSTKDVIAALLGSVMPAGKTAGNFNNHVGVPLSILRLPFEARVAANRRGDERGIGAHRGVRLHRRDRGGQARVDRIAA